RHACDSLLSFSRSRPAPHLHSFPTRRSSDLEPPIPRARDLEQVRPERAAQRGDGVRQRMVEVAVLTLAEAVRGHVDRRAESTLEIGEHTSELQSRGHLVCRLLLEKKKKTEST